MPTQNEYKKTLFKYAKNFSIYLYCNSYFRMSREKKNTESKLAESMDIQEKPTVLLFGNFKRITNLS